ncbi:MAG: HAD-IA family hydrolase [Coriobacteriales bacterium]|nr:HAD-IA family hydrolase [Coriobacteriales bacterium]MBQ6586892.1 HAD-IA family hydrolase [Coriobacteriales bacterium]
MRYEVALFDLDGTILDTIEGLAASLNAARAQQGLAPQSLEQVGAMVGNGAGKLMTRSIAADPGADAIRLRADFAAHYLEHCIEGSRPYPRITEAIEGLRDAGVRCGVYTNKPDAPSQKLITHFFPGLFELVQGNVEGVPVKPAAAPTLATLQRLGVVPGRAIYVGDSEVDIQTAANAGMECISVDWGFKTHDFLLEHGAKCIASSPAQLTGLILRS